MRGTHGDHRDSHNSGKAESETFLMSREQLQVVLRKTINILASSFTVSVFMIRIGRKAVCANHLSTLFRICYTLFAVCPSRIFLPSSVNVALCCDNASPSAYALMVARRGWIARNQWLSFGKLSMFGCRRHHGTTSPRYNRTHRTRTQ